MSEPLPSTTLLLDRQTDCLEQFIRSRCRETARNAEKNGRDVREIAFNIVCTIMQALCEGAKMGESGQEHYDKTDIVCIVMGHVCAPYQTRRLNIVPWERIDLARKIEYLFWDFNPFAQPITFVWIEQSYEFKYECGLLNVKLIT